MIINHISLKKFIKFSFSTRGVNWQKFTIHSWVRNKKLPKELTIFVEGISAISMDKSAVYLKHFLEISSLRSIPCWHFIYSFDFVRRENSIQFTRYKMSKMKLLTGIEKTQFKKWKLCVFINNIIKTWKYDLLLFSYSRWILLAVYLFNIKFENSLR